MNYRDAYQKFWESFGIPAYEENSVSLHAKRPYITYQSIDAGNGEELLTSISVWDNAPNYQRIDRIVDDIRNRIDYTAGITIPCDGGNMIVKAGKPFATKMGEPSDLNLKRVYINISIEYWIRKER